LGRLLTHCKPTHATKGHQASGAAVNALARCSHPNKGEKRSKQPWKRPAVAPCQIQRSGLGLLIQWPLVSLQGPSLSLWSSPLLFPNAAVCLVSSRPLPQAVLQVQLRARRPSPSLQKLIPRTGLTQPHPACTPRAHACNVQRTISRPKYAGLFVCICDAETEINAFGVRTEPSH
jgi:hypothetical protein